MIFYERIKERRMQLDFTQQDLANRSGVAISLIKTVETGRSSTGYENAVKIAEALNISIDEIYVEDFRNTKVITIANNKGGSGKTTVVASLGFAISEIGNNKVLLIDSDMQMNLSYSYGFERNPQKNIDIAIKNEDDFLNYIQKTDHDHIDIIISDFDMAAIEMTLFTKTLRETVFKRCLRSIIDKGLYDYILIDTNPTLGILNFNILNASDFVIVPVEMSAFGILGLEVLTKFIGQAQKINPGLELAGVLRTKVDKRENITQDAEEVLSDVFGDKIFDTYISIDTNIKKSQWERSPLSIYSENSRATKQYKELAKEVLKIVK